MQWCDIGVNFTDARLDIEPTLARAQAAQVEHMLITGTSLTTSQTAFDMTASAPQLYSTAGVHPHYANQYTEQTNVQLKTLAQHNKVVAIGECGLDFNRNLSTPKEQLHAFEQQLELACELQLPVFLHERDAFEQQLALLSQYRPRLVGGVAHCFTGNLEQMQAYLDLDLYIGVTAWFCDPKRGTELAKALPHLPLNRILLETDSPYLRPKGLANNRKLDKGNNEPAYLPYIAQRLAEIIDVPLASISQYSIENSVNLFGLNLTGKGS